MTTSWQIQDGGRTPYWKSFLAISQLHIGRLMRNLDRKWRIRCGGPPFLHISSVNYPISIIFGTQMQISIPRMDFWHQMEILQSQDGGRTQYWKSFFAKSQHHIGQLMWNLERRWRITCRYRSRDQNVNFRKFKMADGCHFENSFISISQAWIIRFR